MSNKEFIPCSRVETIGQIPFTKSEMKIISLRVEGKLSYRQIEAELRVSRKTIVKIMKEAVAEFPILNDYLPTPIQDASPTPST